MSNINDMIARSQERARRDAKRDANKAVAKVRTAGPGAAPREVAIIGGQWKRTKLPVADRPGLRPTPNRVRETLFNWLVHLGGGDIAGWRCLDAFAGSGALGFEAASRGAGEVVMLERDATLQKSLRAMSEKLKASAVKIEAVDALSWMARSAPGRFDVVFLDPPFDADELVAPSLVAARRLLAEGGVIYLEGPRACNPEAIAGMGLEVLRQDRAGAVHYHLFQRLAGEGDASTPSSAGPQSGARGDADAEDAATGG